MQTALQLGRGHQLVTVLCDSGARHLSKFWKQASNLDVLAPDTRMEDVLAAGSDSIMASV